MLIEQFEAPAYKYTGHGQHIGIKCQRWPADNLAQDNHVGQ